EKQEGEQQEWHHAKPRKRHARSHCCGSRRGYRLAHARYRPLSGIAPGHDGCAAAILSPWTSIGLNRSRSMADASEAPARPLPEPRRIIQARLLDVGADDAVP